MSFKIPRFWLFNQPKDEVLKISDCKDTSPPRNKEPTSSHIEKDLKNGAAQCTGDSNSESKCPVLKLVDEDVPSLYYAISLPSNFTNEDKLLVFCDKKEALKAVKTYEGARFKTFHTKEDAVAFASCSVEVTCGTPKNNLNSSPPVFDQEKGSDGVKFKAPKSQSTVLLRKAIVDGRIEEFQTTVWSNPRYLISCGDTPVILQEGFRYNALHVAAKHKQPEICQLILNTLENPLFMKLLYPDDSDSIMLQRTSYITDLYLNMPDKRLCETPLHFASKFGCLEVIRILASHPACDKTRQNKYGLLAQEIICERCPSSSKELKQQIEEAFEGQFFVPVFRSTDNAIQPSVGKPCSKESISVPFSSQFESPQKSFYSVMAYAGPMSPNQAQKFYKQLKTPPINFSLSQLQELKKIRLCDTEKGLERIGRNLAHNMDARWTEYWPSLNTWCDLSSAEGLKILEDHLCNIYHQMLSQVSSINADIASSPRTKSAFSDSNSKSTSMICGNNSNISTSTSSSSGMTKLCLNLENLHLFDKSSEFPSSPETSCILNESALGNCKYSEKDRQGEYLSRSNLNKLSSNSMTPKSKFRRMLKETNKENDPDSIFNLPENLFLPLNDGSMNKLLENGSLTFLYNLKSLTVSLFETFSLMTNLDLNDVEQVRQFAEDLIPELQDLLKSSQNENENLSYVHSFVLQQVYKDMWSQFLEHENEMVLRLLKLYTEGYLKFNSCYKNKQLWQHLECLLLSYCNLNSMNMDKLNLCCCNWMLEANAMDSNRTNPLKWTECDHPLEEDNFFTPPTSPKFDWNSSDDEALTPNEGLEIYIAGDYPSKADVDIMRAIENVVLDSVQYPHICRWKHLILTKDQKIVESWPTPKLSKNRMRNKMSDALSSSPISPLVLGNSPNTRERRNVSSNSLCFGDKNHLQSVVANFLL